jgi:SAM-dependent methyltransferase
MLSKFRTFLKRGAGTGFLEGTFAEKLRRLQPESIWCLDFLRIEGDNLILDGWALVPVNSTPAIIVNGVVSEFIHGISRPDLDRLMPFDPRTKNAGFHATVENASAITTRSEMLEIQLCESDSLKCFDSRHSFYWPIRLPTFPLPNEDRRKRVHGDTNTDGFILSGFSTYTKLSLTLERMGRSWDDFHHVLDWGCGSGRVLRYLPPSSFSRLVGVDIDQDNIRWCETAYPTAQFAQVPLNPPTSLKSNDFDLVLGISVFTHLREESQKLWLSELARITKKGAILLVTILGPIGGARSHISEEAFNEWMSKGFLATGSNLDLIGVINDDRYYVNSLHLHSYIKKEWSRVFDILEIIEGYIGNHQDLVVMRKR